MNLLLIGEPGVGKSTILREVLQKYHRSKYGVISSEIRYEGQRVGFESTSVSDGPKHNRFIAHRTLFLNSPIFIGNKYYVNKKAIDSFVVEEIEKGFEDPNGLIVIDEIGRMQSCSWKFLAAVRKAITSQSNVLATIVYDDKPFSYEPFSHEFKEHPDVILVRVTEQNRDEIPRLLSIILAGLYDYNQLPEFRKKVVDDLLRKYFSSTTSVLSSRYLLMLKLFTKAIPRILETGTIKLIRTSEVGNRFVIKGSNRDHLLEVIPYTHAGSDHIYSLGYCDCDLFNGVGPYVGQAGDCSHVQLYKLWAG